jgi:hypothetical protein
MIEGVPTWQGAGAPVGDPRGCQLAYGAVCAWSGAGMQGCEVMAACSRSPACLWRGCPRPLRGLRRRRPDLWDRWRLPGIAAASERTSAALCDGGEREASAGARLAAGDRRGGDLGGAAAALGGRPAAAGAGRAAESARGGGQGAAAVPARLRCGARRRCRGAGRGDPDQRAVEHPRSGLPRPQLRDPRGRALRSASPRGRFRSIRATSRTRARSASSSGSIRRARGGPASATSSAARSATAGSSCTRRSGSGRRASPPSRRCSDRGLRAGAPGPAGQQHQSGAAGRQPGVWHPRPARLRLLRPLRLAGRAGGGGRGGAGRVPFDGVYQGDGGGTSIRSLASLRHQIALGRGQARAAAVRAVSPPRHARELHRVSAGSGERRSPGAGAPLLRGRLSDRVSAAARRVAGVDGRRELAGRQHGARSDRRVDAGHGMVQDNWDLGIGQHQAHARAGLRWRPTRWLHLEGGARADMFAYDVIDHLQDDARTREDARAGFSAAAGGVSPRDASLAVRRVRSRTAGARGAARCSRA